METSAGIFATVEGSPAGNVDRMYAAGNNKSSRMRILMR